MALEQVYGNVWQYDTATNEMAQYNGTLASFKVNEATLSANREPLLLTQTILSSSLCLPNVPHVTRVQAALNLLTCQFCLLNRDKCEVCLFVCLFICLFAYSFVCLFVCLFICSFVCLLIHLFVYSLDHY